MMYQYILFIHMIQVVCINRVCIDTSYKLLIHMVQYVLIHHTNCSDTHVTVSTDTSYILYKYIHTVFIHMIQ